MMPKKSALLLVIAFAALAGCGLRPQMPAPGPAGGEPFIPVTQAPPSTPTAVISSTAPRPTPTLPCRDGLLFVRDVTIPDYMQVEPNATLDKRWEVENTGTCSWDERYHLRLIAGPEMGTKQVQALFPARSGSRAVIQVVFTAPVKPGSYRSAWQAYNPADEAFGDPIFIVIQVK